MHPIKQPRGASRLGRELVGASPGPAIELRFGSLGLWDKWTTKGQDCLETRRWEQMSSRSPSLRHGGGSDAENESQTIKG